MSEHTAQLPTGRTAQVGSPAMNACPACGTNGWQSAGLMVQGRYPLMHCSQCGLGALRTDDDGAEGFDEYWTPINQRIYAEPAVLAELAHKYEGYFRAVKPGVPNLRFLDVGSGAGVSIGTAAKMGFEAFGVEPSEHAVALSRRQFDVPVKQGLLTADDDLPRDHGLLALWDVIEHVTDPEALIRACGAHLAPGGKLLLETPDEGTLLRRMVCWVGRLNIPGLDLRRSIYYRAHRYYFTRTAMTTLLERCGFTAVEFHGEHTMFQKELRKKELYDHAPRWKLSLLAAAFKVLKALPLLSNKMVVVATKVA